MLREIALIVVSFGGHAGMAAASIGGDWIGGATLGGRSIAISARFSGASESPSGEARLDTSRSAPIIDFALEAQRFRGTVAAPRERLALEGTLAGDVIRGRCQQGAARGSFELFRVVPLDSAARRAAEGVYRLPTGDLISISSGGGRPGALYFADGEHDRSGELFPLSPTAFVAGPAAELCYPFTIRADLRAGPDGAGRELTWQCPGQPARNAPRLDVGEEEISFHSDDAELAGTLVLPRRAGPWPAIVLIGGSGPATRDQFGALPHRLAALGVASLTYDKRGSGRSGGRFHDFLTIDQLARDAAAAVRYLTSRADIDTTRIGLIAASQGGWVAPLVASRRNVAFLVLQSAPVHSVAENQLVEIGNDLRIEGFSEAEIESALTLNRQFHRMVLSGGSKGWDSLRVSLATAEHARWFEAARLPSNLPEQPAAANLRWVERVQRYIEFDPAPLWSQIRIPVLAFYGGMDRNLDGESCARLLRERLSGAGNRDVDVRFYPEGDHALWVVGSIRPTELHRARVKGSGRLLQEWVLRHAGLTSRTGDR